MAFLFNMPNYLQQWASIEPVTGTYDTNFALLVSLDYPTLLSMCSTSSEINRMCDQNILWVTRIRNEFGEMVRKRKPKNISYRESYDRLYKFQEAMAKEGEEGQYELIYKVFDEYYPEVSTYFSIKYTDKVITYLENNSTKDLSLGENTIHIIKNIDLIAYLIRNNVLPMSINKDIGLSFSSAFGSPYATEISRQHKIRIYSKVINRMHTRKILTQEAVDYMMQVIDYQILVLVEQLGYKINYPQDMRKFVVAMIASYAPERYILNLFERYPNIDLSRTKVLIVALKNNYDLDVLDELYNRGARFYEDDMEVLEHYYLPTDVLEWVEDHVD